MAIDAVSRILRFNAGRDPERVQLKYAAMRAGPSAFLRGTCHLFYDRLTNEGVFRKAPAVWVCGDLHLENFGSYRADDRLVYFDLSDFDEAALAPATWDLVRFLTSLQVGADGLHLDRRRAVALCRVFLGAYGASLSQGKAYWVERDTAHGPVRELLDRLRSSSRAAFLESRTTTTGKTRSLRVDGKKALPASATQRKAVVGFMGEFAKAQTTPGYFRVLDVARRVAGTGSLGLDRYSVLVKGTGSPEGCDLLDLKLAMPSALVQHLKLAQPRWPSEAHRIVDLQRREQAVSMALLQPVIVDETAYVLRALQPSEERISFDRAGANANDLEALIDTMGKLVAWAHLRGAGRSGSAIADELIDFGRRTKWHAPLLDASKECASQVRKDAARYNAAFDDGAFRT
jgi:uncharacterized protein (DUF2252 family)